MALSVELRKRLNADGEPLCKRLKLAENTFYATDVPIIRKEDLILQWLCNTCAIDQSVWESLKNCLKTKSLDIKVAVKKMLIDLIIERFQDDIRHMHSNIFDCCILLVSNIAFQQYFISKPEDLGLLTRSLVDCTYTLYKHTHDIKDESTKEIRISSVSKSNELMLQAYNTTIVVLENIIHIFKSAFTTKSRLRKIFVHDVLYPLCAIIDHNCTDNTNRLGAITHKCIQQIILGRKHTQPRDYLNDENLTGFKNLLSVLKKNANIKCLSDNLRTFTFFFRVAVTVFKSDTKVLDTIFRELVECSGIHRKEILNFLLKDLNDVTFDFDNKINNVTLFDYCQNIINDILISCSMCNIDYDLLAQFCYFNPLLIEKRIQGILRKVFLEKSTLNNKDLMICILNVSIHLRQEEKLISSILITLKSCLDDMPSTSVDICYPNGFQNKLVESMNNITNLQIVLMLRTIIYHLKSDCLEMLQLADTCKGLVMLHATIELLNILLSGMCILECNAKFASCKKFIYAFNDLRNILSLLIDKVSHLQQNGRVIEVLLTAIYTWNEMHQVLQYYMPKTVSINLESLILKTEWRQLINATTIMGNVHYQDCVKKLVLQEIRTSCSALNKSSSMISSSINDLDFSWASILKINTGVITLLNNEEMSKLTDSLLEDMTSNINNSNKWMDVLCKEDLQENRRFIIFLLSSVFAKIGHLIPKSITKSICKYFNAKSLFATTILENEYLNDILTSIKEEMLSAKWIRMKDNVLCQINVCLEVLLSLPLMFLSSNLRLITFIFIFSLRLEFKQSKEIELLCNSIISDILERSNLDVSQYIEPHVLLQELPQDKVLQKVLELFLRNCSYANLKKVIQLSIDSNKNMSFLLESMEHVKPKLSVDQKSIIKKAEKKVIKIVLKTLPHKIKETDSLKILNLIVKIDIMEEEINEKLKALVESTVHDMFVGSISNEKFLMDGLQLVVFILHNRRQFQITNVTLKNVWYILFKYPRVDVLHPLLESCESKDFAEFLEEVQARLTTGLSAADEVVVENMCIIWNSILKTNMSNDRNKLRLGGINNLLQIMQTANISEKLWPYLLNLIKNILVIKHLYLPGYIIDMSIFLALKSFEENTILTCDTTLVICTILLKMRTSLITDKIPCLLILYRRILNIVVYSSKDIATKSEEYAFKRIVLDIEKFTSFLIKLKKDMTRISPYLIADLLELFSETLTASFVKVSLQNCINLLISICDHHGITFLSRTLPTSLQEIFKSQMSVYNKFHKFSGKI